MHSVISFPERGPWGDSKWRGNASGFVYKSLFEQLKPKTFCDPMKGSGTSIEVANQLGIKAWGLDLHEGFNAVQDSILNHIGQQVDLCVSHPPYLDIVLYSGNVWGDKPHPADLSRCTSNDEFHEKMQLVLLNQRDATLPGGFYGALVGDVRKNGSYVSTQAELIARMPSEELASVIIKMQHNCVSDSRHYSNLSLFPCNWRVPDSLAQEIDAYYGSPEQFGPRTALASHRHMEIHCWSCIATLGWQSQSF